jgi:hypothetical protein
MKKRTKTAFDTPQWRLLPDRKGPRYYGNVDNVLEVTNCGKTVGRYPVAVPTALFTYLAEVIKAPVHATVHLAADRVADGYVFSVFVQSRGYESLHDLWVYRRLPDWVADSRFALLP